MILLGYIHYGGNYIGYPMHIIYIHTYCGYIIYQVIFHINHNFGDIWLSYPQKTLSLSRHPLLRQIPQQRIWRRSGLIVRCIAALLKTPS